MARNSQRGSKNNNPEGKNQYSYDRPIATAAAAAAAVGAGVFLWSRRNQISEQLSNLSDQIGEWSESRGWSRSEQLEMADSPTGFDSSSSDEFGDGSPGARKGSSRSAKPGGLSETGGGNASLGAHSGGGGMSAGNSGRARA